MRFSKAGSSFKGFFGRRTTLLLILLVAVGGIFIWRYALEPAIDSQRKIREDIEQKKKLLARYQNLIDSRKDVEDTLNQMTQKLDRIRSRLLSGETPQINAANLQEILKKLAEKNGIQIRSFRIGEPKEFTYYVRIPVIIEINPTRSMASLTYFIYDIENYEKKLLISDLDISAPNLRSPNEVQGSLTVVGFSINASPSRGKGKES